MPVPGGGLVVDCSSAGATGQHPVLALVGASESGRRTIRHGDLRAHAGVDSGVNP